ncbi:MAG: ATPase [Woeseia sp.]|nr:ATPase [Woeseia sp.]
MIRCNLLFFIIIFAFSDACAEVLDQAPGGFTVQHQVSVAVSRDDAWAAFVHHIGKWWNSDHTVSGDAANLYINAVPLGCFCERLGDTGGLVHLQVTFANPAVMLRLSGGLGPLGLMGTTGNMTVEFEDDAAAPGRTLVMLRYAVGGYYAGGLDALAAPVDGVLGEQLAGFAAFVGRGKAAQ